MPKHLLIILFPWVVVCSCNNNTTSASTEQDDLTNDSAAGGFNVKHLDSSKRNYVLNTPTAPSEDDSLIVLHGYEAELHRMTDKWRGKPLLNLTAVDFNGKKISLGKIAATKYILLDFWASWCLPCREALPFLNGINEKFGSDLQIVSVTADESYKSWRKAIEEDNMSSWINLQPATLQPHPLPQYYDIPFLPTWILLNKGGKAIGVYGNTQNSKSQLLGALDSLIHR